MDKDADPNKATSDRPLLRSLLRMEVLVTIPTLVISVALAYFSFVQADASRKMQRTESWPFLSYGTGNSSDGKDVISFSLSNDGVGPARLKELEFVYDGKPMGDLRDFLRACCAATLVGRNKKLNIATQPVEGVLRSGDERVFLALAKTADSAPLWNRLDGERWKVVVRSCYCSIFDDCWVLDSQKGDPSQVKVCPADWTKFSADPSDQPTAANR